MYSSGLLLSPELRPGFRFRIMDLAQTERDSYIELDAPERLYDIATLLRDSHRFAIESIWSRKHGEQAAVVSTTRLRNIAGRYVGKDDPVAIVRTQKIFPATEEFGPVFALAPYVAGDTRGSHHMPLMPVRANTPASTFFCVPMVCGLAFSLREGGFPSPWTSSPTPCGRRCGPRWWRRPRRCAARASTAPPCFPWRSWSTRGSPSG